MSNLLSVAEIIIPIVAAILLGILARKFSILTPSDVGALQKFVMNFALPCVVFNSCLTAEIGAESLGTMLILFPIILTTTLTSYRLRKKKFPFHNLPMMFAAQETGMLGIPLFMTLFGADQAFRVGILNLVQGSTGYPTIALLSAKTGENPTTKQIIKKVFQSPLLIMSLTGLLLNLTGIGGFLHRIGVRDLLTSTATFIGQPVSALMIFCVGYNFSLDKESCKDIFRISLLHFTVFAGFGLLMQAALFLIPGTTALTRWSVLLYFLLPPSYLAPGLGKSEKDYAVASGVCSLLTLVTLIAFCIMTAFV